MKHNIIKYLLLGDSYFFDSKYFEINYNCFYFIL